MKFKKRDGKRWISSKEKRESYDSDCEKIEGGNSGESERNISDSLISF